MFPFVFHIHIDDYITIVTGIGVCASAIAALFTINQVKKQREASYQPDIFLGFNSMSSRITNFQTGVREIRCIIYDQNLKETESWGIWHSIENIGLGTAKNVKIEWNFNLKKAHRVIASTVKKPSQVVIENSDLALKNQHGEELIYSYSNVSDFYTHYDFILPRKDERFNKSPTIPQEILEAYTIMFLVRYDIFNRKEIKDMFIESFKEFPSLTAQISYSDIGGKTYSKKLGFEVDMKLMEHIPDTLKLNKIKHLDINLLVNPFVIR